MGKYLLSFDIGTSSCKTALFDERLSVIAMTDYPYRSEYPQDGWVEQHAGQWWDAIVHTTREIVRTSGIAPAEIAGIGIDSMSSMALAVDAVGNPLRNGPIWSDRRAAEEAAYMEENIGELAAPIILNRFDAASFAAKILWYKNNEPDTYEQAEYFFFCNGFLVYRLTGAATANVCECGLSNLCDSAGSTWSGDICSALGIDMSKLPRIMECFEVAGTVTREAAAETGLAEGTPVIAGSMDNTAAVLGMGLHSSGEAYISAGTATNSGICIDDPQKTDTSLLLYRSCIPGLWLVNGGVDFGGAGMRWLKEITGLGYKEIDTLVADADVMENTPVFLPYMTGQRAPLWNTVSRGVFLGINPGTGRAEMIRSVMESIALGIRWMYEIIGKKGFTVSDIRMTGGCANSPPWLAVFSDILGLPIKVPGERDASAVGTAILAGVGTGVFPSFETALSHLSIRETHKPTNDRKQREYYNELFALYTRLYRTTITELEILADIRKKFGGNR